MDWLIAREHLLAFRIVGLIALALPPCAAIVTLTNKKNSEWTHVYESVIDKILFALLMQLFLGIIMGFALIYQVS